MDRLTPQLTTRSSLEGGVASTTHPPLFGGQGVPAKL